MRVFAIGVCATEDSRLMKFDWMVGFNPWFQPLRQLTLETNAFFKMKNRT